MTKPLSALSNGKPARTGNSEAAALQKLLDQSLDVICSIDEEGRFLHVSAAARAQWGYEPEELLGRRYIELVIEEDRPQTELIAQHIMNGHTVTNFENRYHHKHGAIVPLDWSAQWDATEGIMYCVARNASERQQAERQLRLANKKAKLEALRTIAILDRLQDGFFAMDSQWRVTYFNKMAETLTGKTKEEMLGKNFWEVFPSAVNTIAYREYQRALEQRVKVNFEMYSGLFDTWFEVTAYPSRNGLSVYFKNIADRKAQEEAARLTNHRYELLAKATSDAVRDWDLQTDRCYFSEAFATLFGYAASADAPHRVWLDSIHESERHIIEASINQALSDPFVSHWQGEYRLYRSDGSIAFVLDRGFIIRNSEGKALRMVGSMQDITRRRQKAEQIKRLSLVAQETVNGVILTDREQRITWVNQAFIDITGYSAEEALGQKPGTLLQGKNTSPKVRAYLREQISKGLPFKCDIINYSKSGREYWVEMKGQPIFDERGEVEQYFAIQTDITERIELQRMVIEEKIDAQRELTKAIIDAQEKERSEIGKELHDNVNQLLAAIKLYFENMRSYPDAQEMFINKGIELSKKAMEESRAISHRLVTPVTKGASFKSAIEELLDQYHLLGTFKISHQFTVCEDKMADSFRLAIYRILQECLTNIVKYAKATEVSVAILYEEQLVKLIVRDNGAGFDPSTSTMGIGFINIRNRASLFRGKLDIESAPGNGCTVTVLFPTMNDQVISME